MAADACTYNSNHFLLVGAYSTYSSNWRLESYWGVGAYSEVGADLVPYGIKKLFVPVSKTSSYFSTSKYFFLLNAEYSYRGSHIH